MDRGDVSSLMSSSGDVRGDDCPVQWDTVLLLLWWDVPSLWFCPVLVLWDRFQDQEL